jgi:hypothetical protein
MTEKAIPQGFAIGDVPTNPCTHAGRKRLPPVCIEDFSVNNKFTEEPIIVLEKENICPLRKMLLL